MCAGVAQLAEQLICNQQVEGSSPPTSSILMDRFPSGQREQTVNLPSTTSMVRIHPCPPKRFFQEPFFKNVVRMWRNWQTRMVQVHMMIPSCRFKSCHPHQKRISSRDPFLVSFYPQFLTLALRTFTSWLPSGRILMSPASAGTMNVSA